MVRVCQRQPGVNIIYMVDNKTQQDQLSIISEAISTGNSSTPLACQIQAEGNRTMDLRIMDIMVQPLYHDGQSMATNLWLHFWGSMCHFAGHSVRDPDPLWSSYSCWVNP